MPRAAGGRSAGQAQRAVGRDQAAFDQPGPGGIGVAFEIRRRRAEPERVAPGIHVGQHARAANAGQHVAEQCLQQADRSEEHTSELQSLMRISYAVFCLKKKKKNKQPTINTPTTKYTTKQHTTTK